jgi:hypothetical protein
MTITVKTTLTTFFRATRTLAFSALAAATVFAIPAQQADAAVVPVTFSSTTWGYGIAGNVPSDLTAFTSTQIQGFGFPFGGRDIGFRGGFYNLGGSGCQTADISAAPRTYGPDDTPAGTGLGCFGSGFVARFPAIENANIGFITDAGNYGYVVFDWTGSAITVFDAAYESVAGVAISVPGATPVPVPASLPLLGGALLLGGMIHRRRARKA